MNHSKAMRFAKFLLLGTLVLALAYPVKGYEPSDEILQSSDDLEAPANENPAEVEDDGTKDNQLLERPASGRHMNFQFDSESDDGETKPALRGTNVIRSLVKDQTYEETSLSSQGTSAKPHSETEGRAGRGVDKSELDTEGNDQPFEDDLHDGSHDSHHIQEISKESIKERPHDVNIFHPGLTGEMESVQDEHNIKSRNEGESHQAASKPRQDFNVDDKVVAPKDEARLGANDDNPKSPLEEYQINVGPTRKTKEWIPARVELPDDVGESGVQEQEKGPSFTLFTIANTDIGVDYIKLPYRERYLWKMLNAPCHTFNLKIPDEQAEKSLITLCIFRPTLEFPDETKLFIMNSDTEDRGKISLNVSGHVLNQPESNVDGYIVDRFFYGTVTVVDNEKQGEKIYVLEEIHMLNKLMRNNHKTLRNMLTVMNAQNKKKENPVVYNAVVTKSASLFDFMKYTVAKDVNMNPFLMFSTNHNSYICSGEPDIKIDESGQIQLGCGKNEIAVDNEGAVHMKTPRKEYIFRPYGRTIVKEDPEEVRTLQEHEGAVAITAYTSTSTYDCVLPTPAMQPKRRSGYVCKVCLAVDLPFIEYYFVGKHWSIDQYLRNIIDRVSWIFRSMDFNGDNKPDNIGLVVDPQLDEKSLMGEDAGEHDVESLFIKLEDFNVTDCCLGIAFTMKQLPDGALGKRQSVSSTSPSGVCAITKGRIHNNLILVSANNKKGNYTPITEEQLVYTTASHIAGAFGAAPDGAGEDTCDQFIDDHGVIRHYLMWPETLRNTTIGEQTISTCSKKSIMNTLTTCKSSCFDIDKHPFCGNGIVEDGEECDCGSQFNCSRQTCCYARAGKYPCRKSGLGCHKSGAASIFKHGLPYLSAITLLLSAQQFITPFIL